MVSRPLGMSRRAMLVAVGLTPAVLFSLEASATAGSVITAWTNGSTNGVANVPPADRAKFEKCAERLWSATRYAMGVPLDTEDTVVLQALKLSSKALVTNLLSFTPEGFHQNTLGCAGMCGYLSTQQAHMAAGKITPHIYKAAFWQVQAYIKSVGSGGLAC